METAWPQSVCMAVTTSCPRLDWEWDGRFGAALSAFGAEQIDHVERALDAEFSSRWAVDNIGSAPAVATGIAESRGGLRAGQKLFISDPEQDIVVFAAWWPWGGGDRVSVRIGLVSKSGALPPDDVLVAFRKSFEI